MHITNTISNTLEHMPKINTSNFELLNPRQDYVFKRIFGYKGNEDITKDFLTAILNQNITSVDIDTNTILGKDLQKDKVGILDVRAIIDGKINCDIEIQVVDQGNIEKRILFYWSKLYIDSIKEGNDYNKLNKTIIVLILDYNLEKLSKIEHFMTNCQIREKNHPKTVLTDALELYIIELPKFDTTNLDNNQKLLNSWIKFIKNPEEVIDMPNSKIKKAQQVLEEISQDGRERYLADLRQKYIMDQTSLENYGYRKGMKAGIEQIIKRMIQRNLDINTISDLTNVPVSEINKLITTNV